MISTCLSAVLVCSFMLACNPEKARSRDKPAESGTHEISIVVNGLERTYLVHVPAAYKPQIPLPLGIMLHGGGGTAKAAAWETEWTAKAEKEAFIVVFPNALARDPTKASSFAGNPQLATANVSEANGVRTETYSPCRDSVEVVSIEVEGLGHTWPGGRSLLPERMVGKTSNKLRANDVIWAFFREHARPVYDKSYGKGP